MSAFFFMPPNNLITRIISTDEDPSLRIKSSAIINLRGVSTKLKYNLITFYVFFHCFTFKIFLKHVSTLSKLTVVLDWTFGLFSKFTNGLLIHFITFISLLISNALRYLVLFGTSSLKSFN